MIMSVRCVDVARRQSRQFAGIDLQAQGEMTLRKYKPTRDGGAMG
jgi:hypothetical protein